MHSSQPDLRVFLTLVISGCGLVVAGRGLVLVWPMGWGWPLAYAGALTVLVALWCLVAAAAPRLTRTVTVLAVCGVMAGSLLACGIFASREAARRNSAMNNLRQLGIGMQEHMSLAPDHGLAPHQPLSPMSEESGQFGRESFLIPDAAAYPAWHEPLDAVERTDD
jgi:hypothetical protein